MGKEESPVPAPALAQHIAIVGKTGSGKTYAAKGIVEGMLSRGERVCVLDPTGAWWGLRSAWPVVVFGGDHADVPINERAGAAVGELLASKNVPAVIDLSETYLSERQRFVEHFAESIYRLNRTTLHLVIDEADEFAPQNPLPDTKRMLGAIDRIVRRGRIRGFRVMMITQRPAVLHKNVLTQANTLVAMRLTSPQDRKAIEAWIQGQADEAQGREVLQSLARLQLGEGWVWAPEQDVLRRSKFPPIRSHDSSATPTSDAGRPVALVEVDVAGVRDAMAEAVAETEANDPARLRARIAELERQAGKPAPDLEAVRAEAKSEAARGWRLLADPIARKARDLQQVIIEADAVHRRLVDGMETLAAQCGSLETMMLGTAARPATSPRAAAEAPRRATTRVEPSAERGALTGPQRRVVDAIAWWGNLGVAAPTRAQVGFVAGLKPGGGHFNNTVGPLASGGLLEYPEPGTLRLTSAGALVAETNGRAGTLEAYHADVLALLKTGPQRRVIQVLIDHGAGREISREALAEATGLKEGGGHFNNTVGPLRTLGLIEYPRGGMVRGTDLLFPAALL